MLATRYSRHRPDDSKAATCIEYSRSHATPLRVSACDMGATGVVAAASPPPAAAAGVATSSIDLEGVLRAHAALTARYDAYTAAERGRSLSWLCAWARLSSLYYDTLLLQVDMNHPLSRRLPGAHGQRRVRTPLYAGERLGWCASHTPLHSRADATLLLDPVTRRYTSSHTSSHIVTHRYPPMWPACSIHLAHSSRAATPQVAAHC